MELRLNDEQRATAGLAQRFCEKEIEPYAASWEEEAFFPREVFSKLGDLGFTGMNVPEAYGGSALSKMSSVLVYENLAMGDVATAAYLGVHNMVAGAIYAFGNQEQQQRYLPDLAGATQLGAFGLTEPNAGSDAASLETSAVQQPSGEYLVNGRKIFITSGGEAEVYVVYTKTDRSLGARGITALIIPKGTPGFSFGKKEKKMGFNSSPTRELIFEDCLVPPANVLGQVGQGFKIAMNALDGGRINIGACSVGLAQAALNVGLNYARERKQFGRAIVEFQGLQFMLADMLSELEAARMLVYRAACLMDAGEPVTLAAAIAKRYASDMAMRVTTDAVQVLGGNGYMKEYPVERYMRGAKVLQIVEGTNQIQRTVIAREMLR